MIYFKNKKQSSGFTLLEMIVALGIFTLVAVIATGSLVRITGLNRRAQALQSAMNNIGFVLESMSREMRFGSKIHCVNSDTIGSGNIDDMSSTCDSSNSIGIVFRSSKPGSDCQLAYAYWFKESGVPILKKFQQTSCNNVVKLSEASNLIDSTNVKITNITFSVTSGTLGYSLAKVSLAGYSGIKESEKNYFDIRTAVSQRIPD